MPIDTVIIGFAFSAGAVAFLNPCGFAMLPSYVSYFVVFYNKLYNWILYPVVYIICVA
jgi:cytochrome c biogenesis protein CcdA